jgi:hypothetical protein
MTLRCSLTALVLWNYRDGIIEHGTKNSGGLPRDRDESRLRRLAGPQGVGVSPRSLDDLPALVSGLAQGRVAPSRSVPQVTGRIRKDDEGFHRHSSRD